MSQGSESPEHSSQHDPEAPSATSKKRTAAEAQLEDDESTPEESRECARRAEQRGDSPQIVDDEWLDQSLAAAGYETSGDEEDIGSAEEQSADSDADTPGSASAANVSSKAKKNTEKNTATQQARRNTKLVPLTKAERGQMTRRKLPHGMPFPQMTRVDEGGKTHTFTFPHASVIDRADEKMLKAYKNWCNHQRNRLYSLRRPYGTAHNNYTEIEFDEIKRHLISEASAAALNKAKFNWKKVAKEFNANFEGRVFPKGTLLVGNLGSRGNKRAHTRTDQKFNGRSPMSLWNWVNRSPALKNLTKPPSHAGSGVPSPTESPVPAQNERATDQIGESDGMQTTNAVNSGNGVENASNADLPDENLGMEDEMAEIQLAIEASLQPPTSNTHTKEKHNRSDKRQATETVPQVFNETVFQVESIILNFRDAFPIWTDQAEQLTDVVTNMALHGMSLDDITPVLDTLRDVYLTNANPDDSTEEVDSSRQNTARQRLFLDGRDVQMSPHED